MPSTPKSPSAEVLFDSEFSRNRSVGKGAQASCQGAKKNRDGSELAQAPREQAAKAVFEHAGRLIAIKDWSREGMRERLAERFRGHPEAQALASEAAARLEALGALDDLRFARGFIRARLGKRSLQAALRELSRKGISQERAEQAVEELRSEGLVAEGGDHAFDVWRRKFGELPCNEKDKARQARFMASHGFSYSAMSKAWARAKSSED